MTKDYYSCVPIFHGRRQLSLAEMDDPSSHSATQGEPGDREEEQGEEQRPSASNAQNEEESVAWMATTSSHETSNGVSGNPTELAEMADEQTSHDHDTPYTNSDGGSQTGAPEYHQGLHTHFRQLREVLPRTTAAAASSFAAEEELEENNSGRSTGQGGLTRPNDEEDTGREEEPPDLLDRARRYILLLEREQRLLAERIRELQCLLGDPKHGRRDENGPDKTD
jgi:hypothetical protein